MAAEYGDLVSNMSSPEPSVDSGPAGLPARASVPARVAAAAGLVATGVALAAGELGAGVVAGIPSPVAAVSRVIVDLQPPGAKEFVVGLFGTADKLALQLFVVLVALVIGALVGLVGRRRVGLGMAAIGGFVIVGLAASLRDPQSVPVLAATGAALEFALGAAALDRLIRLARGADQPVGAGWAGGGAASMPDTTSRASMPDWGRRRFLISGGILAVASVAVGSVGRYLVAGRRPATVSTLPPVEDPVSLPAGADLGIQGLTPIVVANADFYQIDTSIVPPHIDRDTWRLRIHGMVDHEVLLSYADLVKLPVIEQYVTIACVSNRVGGDLVGNAKWTGVRLRDVLDLAGVKPGATQLVGRSADGWTAGSPTAWVMDPEREPMLAFGMNGQPLPAEHGYPARVIVPGLYGYVSATKWVTELELTTLEAFDAYWIPLGWAKEAPILTQSRIDRPGNGNVLSAGNFTFAGVAWAPDRGIAKVEVQLDDAPWVEASLSQPISKATWVQWKLDASVASGGHKVRVRATDRTGATQTETVTRPDPNGARGWHTVPFTVA